MAFSIVWLIFCALWALKSVMLRRGRRYAIGRRRMDRNDRFQYVSYLAFGIQLVLPIVCYWTDGGILLKFHEIEMVKWVGVGLSYSGLVLYLYTQWHLGRNYSPCFDSHVPFEPVETGPYRFVRHPGWLAKLLAGVGTLLAAGSMWLVPLMVWLVVELRRTIRVEEAYLVTEVPAYESYRARTKMLIPGLF